MNIKSKIKKYSFNLFCLSLIASSTLLKAQEGYIDYSSQEGTSENKEASIILDQEQKEKVKDSDIISPDFSPVIES